LQISLQLLAKGICSQKFNVLFWQLSAAFFSGVVAATVSQFPPPHNVANLADYNYTEKMSHRTWFELEFIGLAH